MTRSFILTALSLAALLTSPSGEATVLEELSLEDLTRRADSVVLGVVGSKSTARQGEQLFTDTEIVVERTLLGPHHRTLIITQLGGEYGGDVVELVGDARLETGARMVLFTYSHPDGHRYLVGMALGAFLVEGTTARQLVDATIAGRDGALGRPQPHATTLAELLRNISEGAPR